MMKIILFTCKMSFAQKALLACGDKPNLTYELLNIWFLTFDLLNVHTVTHAYYRVIAGQYCYKAANVFYQDPKMSAPRCCIVLETERKQANWEECWLTLHLFQTSW